MEDVNGLDDEEWGESLNTRKFVFPKFNLYYTSGLLNPGPYGQISTCSQAYVPEMFINTRYVLSSLVVFPQNSRNLDTYIFFLVDMSSY